MSKRIVKVTNGRDLRKLAHRNDGEVVEAGGSHFKVRSKNPRSTMTAYHGEFSKGVSSAITKWCKAVGWLILTLLLAGGVCFSLLLSTGAI